MTQDGQTENLDSVTVLLDTANQFINSVCCNLNLCLSTCVIFYFCSSEVVLTQI